MTEGFRQQCLLLAWAHIESAACEEGAASSLLWERNEITHAMEAGTSLEQVLCKAEDFPRLSQKFLELQGSNPTSLDVDLADALVFIRLLALLREHFYKMQDGAEALEPVGFDIRGAIRRLNDETGVHLGRAKSINRLRNAFKHQTAKRYGLGGKQANQIVRTMNDLSPDTLEDFSMLASELAGRAPSPSLLSAGFTEWSSGLFAHSDKGVTAEVREDLTITVDGVDAEDLVDWAGMQLSADPASFGARLLEWVTAQRSPEPGFLDDEAEGSGGPDFLPSPEELGVKKERDLLVLTWGKALRKSAPPESEHNFNAGILNGRGGGADLKTMNGLWDEVQSNVASCGLFPRWISMVCAKVEHSNLSCISINCTKGRHRSVAAAEILKKTYYPNATVKHLTIY
eukprot:s5988_g5.t1